MRSLGVEEVAVTQPVSGVFQKPPGERSLGNLHERNEACINGSKEEICSPFNVSYHDRSHHDDEEVDTPIHYVCQRCTLCANAERVDLGCVQPGNGEIRRTEECNIPGGLVDWWISIYPLTENKCTRTEKARVRLHQRQKVFLGSGIQKR